MTEKEMCTMYFKEDYKIRIFFRYRETEEYKERIIKK